MLFCLGHCSPFIYLPPTLYRNFVCPQSPPKTPCAAVDIQCTNGSIFVAGKKNYIYLSLPLCFSCCYFLNIFAASKPQYRGVSFCPSVRCYFLLYCRQNDDPLAHLPALLPYLCEVQQKGKEGLPRWWLEACSERPVGSTALVTSEGTHQAPHPGGREGVLLWQPASIVPLLPPPPPPRNFCSEQSAPNEWLKPPTHPEAADTAHPLKRASKMLF